MVIHGISHHPGSQEFGLFWTIFIGLGAWPKREATEHRSCLRVSGKGGQHERAFARRQQTDKKGQKTLNYYSR
jgi:hypothetical protein